MSNNFISGEPWASGQVVTATKLLKAVQEALVDPSYAGALAAALAASLDSLLIPAGKLDYFASGSVPTGWLECDGAAVSRSTYAALFTAIGTTYGAGDGSTTFAIPDYRGYFLRAAGTNADAVASAALGVKQADAFQGHRHTVTTKTSFNLASGGPSNNTGWFDVTQTSSDPVSDTVNGTPRTASETRPANIAALLCIKF